MRISWIKALFLIWPLLEIIGFIIVDRWLGIVLTLLLVVGSTVFGFFLLRVLGLFALLPKARRQFTDKQFLGELVNVPLIGLAGLLFIIPGFLTDIVGLLILIPGIRNYIVNVFLASKLFKTTKTEDPSGRTLEGTCWREDDKLD